ncbi:hypothetical protein [Streptomyces sp. NPDC001843]|uniref:hypothetical protein n=1 Tax=Streptomyces sp. NPDC001843 TaxID=3364617 RepID=UPI0036AF8A5F
MRTLVDLGSTELGLLAAFSAGFAKKMRLMDKDAYWLGTAISGDCVPQTGSFIKCTMTAN